MRLSYDSFLSPVRSVLRLAPAVLLTFPAAVPAAAEDWPQWRGKERNGRSSETGLLKSWPEGGPPLAWRTTGMGTGYSSLAVVGERIYTTGDHGERQYAIAVARKNGKTLWKTDVGLGWEDKYIGARSTPTVDGDRIYVLSTEGEVVALDAATGKEAWRRNLVKDFGGGLMQAQGKWDWKFVESPLVDGDRVIVTPGAKSAALVALEKKTGKELWRTKLPDDLGPKGTDGAGYSSVVVSNAGGLRQYVQLLGRGVIGVEASSGRFLWGYNPVANGVANIATPIIDGDYVFASTGYDTGAALIELHKQNGGFQAKEVYFLPPNVFQNHHGGLILDDGHIYTGTGHNKGFPLCIDQKTGKVTWGPIRNEGRDSAAIIYADGHLYFRYQDGTMILAEANPEEYRQKGAFKIPEVNQFSWSHPVIAGGMLYLREQDHLFAYDIRAR